jgi:hypothetical protein
MSYVSAWSIQFALNDHYYKLLTDMVDTINEAIGESSDPDVALKALYPKLDLTIGYNITLAYERIEGDVIIYNDDCDGGSDIGAEIVRAFLQQHDLPTRVGFICGFTDRNEGGGVAYHITKHGVIWKNLDMVLDELITANKIDWQNNPQILT